MPHVRHGGRGKLSVAVVGSKFDGTGFVKEHIGQIQLPLSAVGALTGRLLGLKGLDDRDEGEDADA